jgi:hypothetical protein
MQNTNRPIPESCGKLSTLDLIFSVMDSPRSPLDFTLVLQLKKSPSLVDLRAGAISARNRYPTTGSYIDKKQWVRFPEPGDGVRRVSTLSDGETTKAIEDFLNSSFDLRVQMPVQQLVIMNESRRGAELVTRFHHAAADGLSAAMWLKHQLGVAYGHESLMAQASTCEALSLRTSPSPAKRSQFAFRRPSDRLWTSNALPSGARRWLTIGVAATDLRKGCRRTGGFTYSDLLATCALEVFRRWNRARGDVRKLKIGLWLPVNVRQRSSVGFGNGTSRIRLYARYADKASLVDKCREVRRQVSWSGQHGEWFVPQDNPLESLPLWAITPLLRCYLNRPGLDMATGVFSHAEGWGGASGESFREVEKIECIGLLHPRQCVAINGATHLGQTWLTFTYDPAMLSRDDIQQLSEMYQEQIALARRELT